MAVEEVLGLHSNHWQSDILVGRKNLIATAIRRRCCSRIVEISNFRLEAGCGVGWGGELESSLGKCLGKDKSDVEKWPGSRLAACSVL